MTTRTAHCVSNTVEPVLEDCTIGHNNVVSQGRYLWSDRFNYVEM